MARADVYDWELCEVDFLVSFDARRQCWSNSWAFVIGFSDLVVVARLLRRHAGNYLESLGKRFTIGAGLNSNGPVEDTFGTSEEFQ